MQMKHKIKLALLVIASFFFGGLKSMLGVIGYAKIADNSDRFDLARKQKQTAILSHLSFETVDRLQEQLQRIKAEYGDRELQNFVFGVNEFGELVIEGTREQFQLLVKENEELEDYIQLACHECVFTCV